jgi:hypothetical protein
MNSETKDPEAPVPVEIHIRQDIRDAAFTRALSQGETLASVVRAAYYLAAAQAKPVENPVLKPRPYGEDRDRIRFKVPAAQREHNRKKIEASGETVPAAVERILRRYVDTGTIVGVAASTEPEQSPKSEPLPCGATESE